MPLPAAGQAVPPRRDRPWAVVALAAVFLIAIVVTVVGNPHGVRAASNPDLSPVPVPLLLVPPLLTIAATLLLPRGTGTQEIGSLLPGRLRWETAALLGLFGLYPVLALALGTEVARLLKPVLFIAVPCLALWLLARRNGPSVAISRPRIAWWIPLLPALMLGVLVNVGPFSIGSLSLTQWPPLGWLIAGTLFSVVSAALGEELFCRRFLQTRLEALVGPWTGVLVTSLLFGLVHISGHGDGALWERAAQVIALQGVNGIAYGLIWWRWRRLWACVLAHALVNDLVVLLYLMGLAG